jgi:hypothetical protein
MDTAPVARTTAPQASEEKLNVAGEPQTAPTLPMPLTDRGFNLALTNYGHIEQQAALSATKSALLVAAHALLGAVYVGLIKDYGIFKAFAWKLEAWLFFLGGLTLLAGFLLSLYAILPKSRSDETGDILFYASIQGFSSAREYVDAYRAKDPTGLDTELLQNTYGKSCWLRKNFYLIRWAIYCSCAATLMAVLAIILMRNAI